MSQCDGHSSASRPVDSQRKTIFLSLSGAPNVGKSSILNALLGTKLVATSYRPQTTRNNIKGIITKGDSQVVFIDTPGFFKPREELEKKIVKTAVQTLYESEAVCAVLEPSKGINAAFVALLEKCSELGKPVIVIINKMDTIRQHKALPLAKDIVARFPYVREVFFVSAKTGYGVDSLKEHIFSLAKPDAWYFDPDQNTDRDISFVASEITREKLFLTLKHEIPYGINVVTTTMYKDATESGDIVLIKQDIETPKESHKGIIIGPKGDTLKMVSSMAVIDLEEILKTRVSLNLSVKVRKWHRDWESS